jgi:ribosomal-protein-alanine N-acetyltransferase
MNNLTIETMKRAHIPGIVDIEQRVFKTPWTDEMFVQELEANRLTMSYVVLDESRMIGYMIAWLLRQEVHLVNIAVEPSRQRSGIGRFMLRYLFDLAAQAKRRFVTLEVRESNESAICLYESFGFKRIGVRPHYYEEDGENAVVMVRFVPPDEGTDPGEWT